MKVAEEILKLVPYRPGKPIEETKREYGLEKVFKLASNENPLGPSPKVIDALSRALTDLHRYPDAACHDLRQSMSSYYGLAENQLTFGNGSNELIDLLIHLYSSPGDAILTAKYAFIAYRISAQAACRKVIEAEVHADLSINLEAMKKYLQRPEGEKIRLVFIPNPNNPTGLYLKRQQLSEFLTVAAAKPDTLFVLDEAYLEFVRAADYPNGLEYLKLYPNIVLLRTMSKVFGIAGLRLGTLLAQAEVIELVNRIRNPFNVNSLAQVAGIAASQDASYLSKVKSLTWEGLDYFYSELQRLGLKYWPSQGNFVLFDSARDSTKVFQALLRKGVILRPVDNYGLKTHIRMSVGLKNENQAAIKALELVLKDIPPL